MRKYLLTLLLFALPLFFYAQTKTVTFSATGTTNLTTTFVIPAGSTSLTISAWGGGGAGGGTTNAGLSLEKGAAGGGGGAFAGGVYTISSGVTISLTAGGAGAGGTGVNGQTGKTSSVTGFVSAVGGGGGTANTSGGTPAKGAGGLASSSVGTNTFDGGSGVDGQSGLTAASGSGGNGGNGGGAGGAGFSSLLGTADGNPGTVPGGGGGGAKSSVLGAGKAGGDGGPGRVVISYDCSTYSLTSTSASAVNICSGTSSTITLNGSLPVGVYSVAYQVDGVTQTPASMTVTGSGSGTFTAPGFSALGAKTLTVTSLTSGTSGNAADNCVSTISANNTTTVNVTSSGTAPVALAGTAATCTQITANWQSVAGATYYTLDLSTDINFGSFVGTYNGLNVGNVLTTNITGLSNATTYYYRVRAFNGGCLSAYSNTITYKPAVSPGNVVLQAATNIFCTAFKANWTAEVNAVSYLLDVSLVSNFASFVTGYNALDIGNVTTYTVTGLTVGTTYYYRLRSKNGCGTSATGTATVQNITTTTLPSTPTISPSGSVTICQNGNVTLTSSSASNNVWSTGATTQSIVVTTAGSYTVKVVNPGSCESGVSAATTVAVASLPTATAGGSVTICSNATATVSGASFSNGTILWTFSGGTGSLSNATTLTPTYTPALGGAARTVTLTMTVTSNNACAPQTATATYTVNIQAEPTAASSGSQTICANAAATVSGASAANGTILWTHNGSGSLTNATTAAPTYTSVTADSGNVVTLTMTVTASPTCTTPYTATATYPITVKPVPNTPLNDPPVQPTCDALTGTVVLKNLPNRNDYTIVQTGTVSHNYTGGIGGDWTKYTVTGLAPGTYHFTVEYPGSCTSLPLQNIVINALATNTYTIAGGWSLGTPTVSQKIVFADDFSSSGDVNSCGCTVNAGKKVTINSSNTLTVKNALVVDPAPDTSLTFKSSSSLFQVNTAVNSGSIFYERTSPGIFKKDYLYWSTPVNPQRLIDLSSGTAVTKYFGFDGTQWVVTDRTTNMVVGKGYIIRGPETYSNTVKAAFTGIFSGVPNNGNLEGELLSSGKSYLVGNPYPSALSADALLGGNSLLGGTIYFWTHNTPVQLTYTNQYTTDDYASYNLSGGVSAKSDPLHSDNPANDNGIKPTGKIAAGQSFFVTTVAAGKVQFNNSMRVAGNNNQFFKSENTSKETAVVKKRIWLNMSNTSGAFKQLLVGYIEGATNEYDTNYDGISFNANPYLDFYSIANGNNYVIQGRALPFVDTDIVPLGYRTTIAGEFTISIDEADLNMNEQPIYIEDKVTGVIHDLKASNYTFTTTIGTFSDRLVLRYKGKTLGRGDFENQENAIFVSVKNRVINVISSKEQLKEVSVFDLSGKLIYNKKKISDKELQITNLTSGSQMVLVKVTLENDSTGTRKIVF